MEPVIEDEAGDEDGADGVDKPSFGEVVRDGAGEDGERVGHDVVFVVFG